MSCKSTCLALQNSMLNLFLFWLEMESKNCPFLFLFVYFLAYFQISKLEKALQQTLTDLHTKNEQIVHLEGIVADQQNALKKEQERMRDLEETRTHLQQQVALLEEEINRERNTSQVESSDLQQRLQDAKDDIDERTRQINELNSTLRGVHKDMKQSSASIVELEQLLQQSRSQCDKKTAQAQTLDQALKETQQQLSAMTKKNGELEERLRQMENEFTETTEQNAQLDTEVFDIAASFCQFWQFSVVTGDGVAGCCG